MSLFARSPGFVASEPPTAHGFFFFFSSGGGAGSFPPTSTICEAFSSAPLDRGKLIIIVRLTSERSQVGYVTVRGGA
jgi:hypothetical protein